MSDGDSSVSEELMELIYGELHGLAKRLMARERRDHTLQPTALVNEAFLRLVGREGDSWESRKHFYSMASSVMRTLLVDYARSRGTKKRGGDRLRLPLDMETPDPQAAGAREIDVLDLNDALEQLAEVNEDLVRPIELYYFGGLTVRETADTLELPLRTVERRLQTAGAWLREKLDG